MTRSILFAGSVALSSLALLACEVKVNNPDNPPPPQAATAAPASTTPAPAAPPPPAPAPRIDGK